MGDGTHKQAIVGDERLPCLVQLVDYTTETDGALDLLFNLGVRLGARSCLLGFPLLRIWR